MKTKTFIRATFVALNGLFALSYQADARQGQDTAPAIVGQPQSQKVLAGSDVNISVAVDGQAPIHYQWKFAGTNLSDQTSSELNLYNVQPSEGGSYSVVVSNAGGTIGSQPAIVSVSNIIVYAADSNNVWNIVENGATNYGLVNIEIACAYSNGAIFYTLDGTAPDYASDPYPSDGLLITNSCTLNAIAYSEDFSESALAGPINIVVLPTCSFFVYTFGGGTISFTDGNQQFQGTIFGSSFPSNSMAIVTAQPIGGDWTFMGWTGDVVSTNPCIDVVLNNNISVDAHFGTPFSTTVQGNGSLVVFPNFLLYSYDTAVEITAIPQPGYYLASWGNAVDGNDNPLRYVIKNTDQGISALFAPLPANQVSLAVEADGDGAVSIDPATNCYDVGSTVTINAFAYDQAFLGWSGDASGTNNPLTITMDQSKVIVANFSRAPVLYDLQVGTAGKATVMNIVGLTGDTYEIQASADLINWTPLSTATNFYGFVPFLDTSSPSAPSRMYRARVVSH